MTKFRDRFIDTQKFFKTTFFGKVLISYLSWFWNKLCFGCIKLGSKIKFDFAPGGKKNFSPPPVAASWHPPASVSPVGKKTTWWAEKSFYGKCDPVPSTRSHFWNWTTNLWLLVIIWPRLASHKVLRSSSTFGAITPSLNCFLCQPTSSPKDKTC